MCTRSHRAKAWSLGLFLLFFLVCLFFCLFFFFFGRKLRLFSSVDLVSSSPVPRSKAPPRVFQRFFFLFIRSKIEKKMDFLVSLAKKWRFSRFISSSSTKQNQEAKKKTETSVSPSATGSRPFDGRNPIGYRRRPIRGRETALPDDALPIGSA